MSIPWPRRALMLFAGALVALVAACGGGKIDSQLEPGRIVSFGTGLSDVGQGGSKYTVNDGTVNIWTERVAVSYGLTVTAAVSGGRSYSRGNVRVKATPDAAGSAATRTVEQQIDDFLAADTFRSSDLVLVDGGTSDVVTEVQQVILGLRTPSVAAANARQAGQDLGAQVLRAVTAGARYVIVVGSYNLGRSPWAAQTGQGSLMEDVSTEFNNGLLISLAGAGSNVLYVDAALFFNLVTASPGSYGLVDAASVVCTSVDPGPGIGTGTNQVNSALCTPATVINPAYNNYVFADRVYFTPNAQNEFGEYAYDRIRARF